jgi:hypothetical protein
LKNNAALGEDGPDSQRALNDADETAEEDEYEFVRPALFDRFLQCKLVAVILLWLFWMFTLGMTFVLAVYSGNDEVKEGIEAFVELTPKEANEFVLVWYMSILVWGVLLNELRIVIISLLAPIQA